MNAFRQFRTPLDGVLLLLIPANRWHCQIGNKLSKQKFYLHYFNYLILIFLLSLRTCIFPLFPSKTKTLEILPDSNIDRNPDLNGPATIKRRTPRAAKSIKRKTSINSMRFLFPIYFNSGAVGLRHSFPSFLRPA